jgi:hypothetical protein
MLTFITALCLSIFWSAVCVPLLVAAAPQSNCFYDLNQVRDKWSSNGFTLPDKVTGTGCSPIIDSSGSYLPHLPDCTYNYQYHSPSFERQVWIKRYQRSIRSLVPRSKMAACDLLADSLRGELGFKDNLSSTAGTPSYKITGG